MGKLPPWAIAGAIVCAALVLGLVGSAADKPFVMPRAFPAQTYPAVDNHPQEKVAIAADPYDMADKAAIFKINYHEEGLLPVFLVITNDGDKAVSFRALKVELVTVQHDRIEPATPDDIYRRVAHRTSNQQGPSRNPLPVPIPLPKKKSKQGITPEARDEIENSQFIAQAVEPHATQSGFLFFDVRDIPNPLAGAHIYISGLRDASGQELMFFDLPMEKYLSYQPGNPSH